ncbi:uncharacterized protein [Thunnus thynnus]|uniref:uncharacterized protein n=1 Tax=Thunnus thynnus TaxID=8237 RepID=UPI003528C357
MEVAEKEASLEKVQELQKKSQQMEDEWCHKASRMEEEIKLLIPKNAEFQELTGKTVKEKVKMRKKEKKAQKEIEKRKEKEECEREEEKLKEDHLSLFPLTPQTIPTPPSLHPFTS